MSAFPVGNIAIIGSGPTAWLAAAMLARVLHGSCAVQVIETDSDDATWVAVTSVPSLHRLLRLLGLDEVTLMRAGDATYRLGAEFRDWGALGERYFAGFGGIGTRVDAVPFQHYWLRARRSSLLRARGLLQAQQTAAQPCRYSPHHHHV
jgi:tryptophan 7-halogenase